MLSLQSSNFAAPINSHLHHHHHIHHPKYGFFCDSKFPKSNGRRPLSSSFSRCFTQKINANPNSYSYQQEEEEEEEEEEEYRVLCATRSNYNDIIIVDTPKSRMLLLDSTHNVHSILYKHQKWTGSYWDEFASLPAIIPEGPIAILGLGGGTAAHLMLDLWPSLQLKGWEIDDILIDKARDYFWLSDLEKHNQAGGVLDIHIGDALSRSSNQRGRYAGIIVDLFYEGKVLAKLLEAPTWLELTERLMPNGRFMVNCGGIGGESDVINGEMHFQSVDIWVENSTIKALTKAFPGQLNWKRMPETEGANFMALTGNLPDLDSWSAMVPDRLSETVKKWRPCAPLL